MYPQGRGGMRIFLIIFGNAFCWLANDNQLFSHGVMTGTLGKRAVSTARATRCTTKGACATAMWQREWVDRSIFAFTISREFRALSDRHCTEIINKLNNFGKILTAIYPYKPGQQGFKSQVIIEPRIIEFRIQNSGSIFGHFSFKNYFK